jgi:hypothetical protein
MAVAMSETLLLSATRMQLPALLAYYESSVQLVINSWEALCHRAVTSCLAEELHTLRDECEWSFRQGIEGIDRSLSVLDRKEHPESIPMKVRLHALRDQLSTKYAELFPKWQTLEDLEEILLAALTVPNERLISWAKRNPTSAEDWYNAPDDAFPPRE